MWRRTTTSMPIWWGLLATATLAAGCAGSPRGGSTGHTEADQDNVNSAATTDLSSQGSSAGGDGVAFPEDTDPMVTALPFVQDELLARTLPGADDEDLDTAYAEAGAIALTVLPEIETTVLRVQPGALATVAAELAGNPLFESIHKNYLYEPEHTPNDPEFESQAYLELLSLPEAWEITTGATDLVIAVLDSGVAGDHPDLAAKLLDGWNTFDDTDDTNDIHGHGTSVAGVAAAASNNGVGIAGINWESPIMPMRVTNADGQASSRSIAAGLIWAADHGARVFNVSFAPLASDRTVLRAARSVNSSGGLVFISAGNEGERFAARNNKYAVFVGATDSANQLASFSTYGPFVDLVAPGTGIAITTRNGGYAHANGTSFSSPIVAGVAALAWSVRPELRPVTVEQALAETAIDLGTPGRDESYGAGLIDAAAAVATALEIVEQEDRIAPEFEVTKPQDGELASRMMTVVVSAADAEGVADVVLSIDGRAFASDTAEPHRFVVNTTRLTPGIHTLTCIATDRAGNSSAPTNVRILVGEGSQGSGDSQADTVDPTVAINFPVDGTSVIASVGIQATATDNAGLAQAEWSVDGATKQTTAISGTRAVISFVWDATTHGSGVHRVTVRVTDAADNHALATLALTKQ